MDVLHTVEIRWFQPGPTPAAARAWFDALGPEVLAESRVDAYLTPESDALGVKLREGAVEAKRRTDRLGSLAVGAGEVEAWTKWSFPRADAATPDQGWVEVAKTRRQRHAPSGDCALELSEVVVRGETWWSVCLEATGADLAARRAALADGARQWLASAPALPAEAARGYPAWLRSIGR